MKRKVAFEDVYRKPVMLRRIEVGQKCSMTGF